MQRVGQFRCTFSVCLLALILIRVSVKLLHETFYLLMDVFTSVFACFVVVSFVD